MCFNLTFNAVWTGAGSGLLTLMLKKMSLFIWQLKYQWGYYLKEYWSLNWFYEVCFFWSCFFISINLPYLAPKWHECPKHWSPPSSPPPKKKKKREKKVEEKSQKKLKSALTSNSETEIPVHRQYIRNAEALLVDLCNLPEDKRRLDHGNNTTQIKHQDLR